MTTHSKAQLIMDHILQNVFELAADSPLEQALSNEGYVSPKDFLTEEDSLLQSLCFTPEPGKVLVKIPKGSAGLLKSFKQFIAHQVQLGHTFEDDNDWTAITRKEFNSFRTSTANGFTPMVIPSALQHNVCLPPVIDLVKD